MRKPVRPGSIFFFIFFFMAAAVAALADHPSAATSTDLGELRTEVNRLDDSLSLLDDSHPRAREFREREAEIRDELVWLREQIRRHEGNERRGLGASKAEVDKLRQEIRSLRDDIEDAYGVPLAQGRIDVPDGTEIQVRLEESLSSKTARVEDRVEATVAESVTSDGRLAIPAGTEVSGVVRSVQPAERPAKGGRLEMSFESIVLDGQPVNMDARVVEVEESGLDKSKAGLGAIIGGVLGAVIDGKKGALIGAIVGGTGAVVATAGDEVELPAGTLLTVRLERPLTVASR